MSKDLQEVRAGAVSAAQAKGTSSVALRRSTAGRFVGQLGGEGGWRGAGQGGRRMRSKRCWGQWERRAGRGGPFGPL